ncbi:MAG: hypothetical protein LUJ09_04185 [Firmicutes bacterium]|nr:hypothetical protein [Bacillota bacterium]
MSENEKPRWTAEDIADAKAVRQLCPQAEAVERSERNTVIFIIQSGKKIGGAIKDAFPSLKPGETVTLDETLEAENG